VVRIAQRLTIGGFMLLLILPAVQKRYPFIHCPAVDENRKKYEKPVASMIEVLLNRHGAAAAYEKYYNDHYGLRDLFIRVKNQIDYSVFCKSDKVHIGADGWLFYRSVLDTEEPGVQRCLASQERDVPGELDRIQEQLRRKGVTLVYVPCPQKNTVYPELVPRSGPRRPQPLAYHRFCSAIQRDRQIMYIDAFETLMKLKRQYPVYYRTDFHWNEVAGYFIGKEIVEQIGRREGTIPRYYPLEIELRPYSGDQALFLPMLWTPAEEAPFLVKKCDDEGSYETLSNSLRGLWFRYRNYKKGVLPPVVVYGDSFQDSLIASGFQCYFKEVYRAHLNYTSFSKVVELLPPQVKYLVVVHIEVAIPRVFAAHAPFEEEPTVVAAAPGKSTKQ
jgi:hypothetical protein